MGADGSGGATPATAAGCLGELHGFTSTPRFARRSHSSFFSFASEVA